MAFFKKCCQNCLASICLVLMAGVSFTFFDLGNAISGSLFVNFGSALQELLQIATGSTIGGSLLTIVITGVMGLSSILIFPVHWMLYYRPDEVGMALALVIPWILCIGISSALFAKKAKDGLFIGLFLAIGYIIFGTAIYILVILGLQESGAGGIGTGMINGIFIGLTGMHPLFALFMACLEGALVGSAFGALIGALKYDPKKTPPKTENIQEIYSTKSTFEKSGSKMLSSKSKTTAGILAIFLGGIGVHKFYLGKIGMGILRLVFCWTFIPAVIGLIEGILYLSESEDKFQAKRPKQQKNGKQALSTEPKTEDFSYGSKTNDGKKTKKCPFCGANVKEDVKFCVNCQNYL